MRSSALPVVLAVLGAVACGGGGGEGEGALPGSSSGGVPADGTSSGGTTPPPGTSSGTPVSPSLALSAPSGVTLGRAGPLTLSVEILRKGGTASAVTLRVSGLPAGFTSDPVTVDAKTSVAKLTLRASEAAPTSSVAATIEAVSGTLSAKTPLSVVAPRGAFDASFGSAGVVSLPFEARDVLSLDDGSVLVFGSEAKVGAAALLSRFDAKGVADASFGPAGVRVFTPPPTHAYASSRPVALAAKGDGTFYALVDSNVFPSTVDRPAIVHVLVDGSFDAGFGAGGWASVAFQTPASQSATGLAVQPDGKLVISAVGYGPGTRYALLARFTASGQLDASFGAGGRVETKWGKDRATADGVRLLDGKLHVFGGAASGVSDDRGYIARLDDAGNLDPSFGAGGALFTTSGPVGDVVKTPAGKLLTRVAGGYFTQLATTGTVDTTFGASGSIARERPLAGVGQDYGSAPFAVDAGGRIHVLLGSITYDRLEAWSFDAAGTRQTTFGAQGSLRVPTPGGNPIPLAMRTTADGRLLALGTVDDTYKTPSVLFRFLP
jgi:uncharacterized delta-60 repeat protein